MEERELIVWMWIIYAQLFLLPALGLLLLGIRAEIKRKDKLLVQVLRNVAALSLNSTRVRR